MNPQLESKCSSKVHAMLPCILSLKLLLDCCSLATHTCCKPVVSLCIIHNSYTKPHDIRRCSCTETLQAHICVLAVSTSGMGGMKLRLLRHYYRLALHSRSDTHMRATGPPCNIPQGQHHCLGALPPKLSVRSFVPQYSKFSHCLQASSICQVSPLLAHSVHARSSSVEQKQQQQRSEFFPQQGHRYGRRQFRIPVLSSSAANFAHSAAVKQKEPVAEDEGELHAVDTAIRANALIFAAKLAVYFVSASRCRFFFWFAGKN